ncbi:MAG: NTP transferase domain-containing protein [Reyranellaceae bacterium]
MKFGDTPLSEAEGAILAHSWRAPGKSLSKGRVLSAEDIETLRQAGVTSVVAARLEADDVPEDQAAARLARALAGQGLTVGAAFTGRVNLFAASAGIIELAPERIDALNLVHEAITVATLSAHATVTEKQMVATIKIIPFAAPRAALEQCLTIAGNAPLLRVASLRAMKAGLVQTMVASTKPSVLDKTVNVTRKRLEDLGSTLIAERRCRHDAAEVAAELEKLKQEGCELLLVAGASAIVDRRDVVPAGIEQAGGTIRHFGMPVDPGNLLLFADMDEKPVIGLPGCARSPKFNGLDQVLQRLLAGLPVGPEQIMRMGVGGLLAEIPSRPLPRAETEAPPTAPRIAALLLAAGMSRRMGGPNKLLQDLGGEAMVARTLNAVRAAAVDDIVVVLGHNAAQVRQAVVTAAGADKRLRFVENPNFAEGLSTSLQAGLAVLPEKADAVLVCLADMPAVTAAQIDRLIAAFNPVEQRAICVPTYQGKRGNPILWARRFVPEMLKLAGDVGARHLIGENAETVCEVEMGDAAVLTDLDTPEALRDYLGGWR